MSSKNVKQPSIEGDQYYTPPWCTRQCVEIVLPVVISSFANSSKSMPETILEPSAGSGAFVDALRQAYPYSIIHACDINTSVGTWDADHSFHGDFLHCDLPLESYGLIAGNPPYSIAQDIVARSIEVADIVVYLLRQGFMASAERAAFFRRHTPSHVFNLAHRPSFTVDGGTDSADYAFICWTKGHKGSAALDWLPAVPLDERKVLAERVKGYRANGDPSIVVSHKLFG